MIPNVGCVIESGDFKNVTNSKYNRNEGLLFSVCQIVKWIKFKLKKSKLFSIFFVLTCIKTILMKAFTVHDVFL
jgi:hypothetical protein